MNIYDAGCSNATNTTSVNTYDAETNGQLSKKHAANRRNARLSTGPKTESGKRRSRRNALKHGILASALLVAEGTENAAQFHDLLSRLNRDLAPDGPLEELLVEKIAICCWRERRALQCEASLIQRSSLPDPTRDFRDSVKRMMGFTSPPELAATKSPLSLPLGADLDRILRYETTIQRQMVSAIAQLERLQRTRKGDHLLAPMTVQLSSTE